MVLTAPIVALLVELAPQPLVLSTVLDATAVAVLLTVVVAWSTRDRAAENETKELIA